MLDNVKFPFTVELAGDSIWGYTGPRTVTVTGIHIEAEEDSNYKLVSVTHDTDWRIYTDTGFEKAISEAVGFEVDFTEQGMQDDGYATLEN
jgi:hypothetical protein